MLYHTEVRGCYHKGALLLLLLLRWNRLTDLPMILCYPLPLLLLNLQGGGGAQKLGSSLT